MTEDRRARLGPSSLGGVGRAREGPIALAKVPTGPPIGFVDPCLVGSVATCEACVVPAAPACASGLPVGDVRIVPIWLARFSRSCATAVDPCDPARSCMTGVPPDAREATIIGWLRARPARVLALS